MANRKQRRDSKKILKRPEVKKHVDKLFNDLSEFLVDECEQARERSSKTGEKIDFENIHSKFELIMKEKGEEFGHKIKSMTEKNNMKVNFKTK